MEEKILQIMIAVCYTYAFVLFSQNHFQEMFASVLINLENHVCCFKDIKFIKVEDF